MYAIRALVVRLESNVRSSQSEHTDVLREAE